MNAIAVGRPERPADLSRRLVRAGLMSGLAITVYLVLVQFEASKECHGGAFSAGFSRGFDVRRCSVVIGNVVSDLKVRIPLPW